MQNRAVSSQVLTFLKKLNANNNRDWFNDHKEEYKAAHAEMVAFANQLIETYGQFDELETMSGKQSLFRIYRDIRFSKDKTPYKAWFSGGLKRATKWKRGGYYFQIQPGASMVGGGFWGPNPDDLKRIRLELATDAEPLRKIIASPDFVYTFGQLEGEKVKTAPKGYKKDHPNIDLLRYKQFLVTRRFSDEEVLAPDFLDKIIESYKNMLPFFNYMSEVLTTDENGVPLED